MVLGMRYDVEFAVAYALSADLAGRVNRMDQSRAWVRADGRYSSAVGLDFGSDLFI